MEAVYLYEQLAAQKLRVQSLNEQLQKANRKLAHEQFLLKELVDNIPDPVFFKDRESRFIRVNQSMARDAGFVRGDRRDGPR